VFTGGEGQIAIGFAEFGLERHAGKKFLLRISKLLLPEQRLTETAMEFGVVRMRGQYGPIDRLSAIMFSRRRVEFRQVALNRLVCWSKLRSGFQLGDRVFMLAFGFEYAPQLHMSGRLVGTGRHQLAEVLLSFGETASPHVDIRQPGQRIRRGIESERLLVPF